MISLGPALSAPAGFPRALGPTLLRRLYHTQRKGLSGRAKKQFLQPEEEITRLAAEGVVVVREIGDDATKQLTMFPKRRM